MSIIPTTDALTEPTVMRQIKKVAEYTDKNFAEIGEVHGSKVTLTLKSGYYTLEVIN